jgi:hypothetical protein
MFTTAGGIILAFFLLSIGPALSELAKALAKALFTSPTPWIVLGFVLLTLVHGCMHPGAG